MEESTAACMCHMQGAGRCNACIHVCMHACMCGRSESMRPQGQPTHSLALMYLPHHADLLACASPRGAAHCKLMQIYYSCYRAAPCTDLGSGMDRSKSEFRGFHTSLTCRRVRRA